MATIYDTCPKCDKRTVSGPFSGPYGLFNTCRTCRHKWLAHCGKRTGPERRALGLVVASKCILPPGHDGPCADAAGLPAGTLEVREVTL